jgi:hypothetical protein
METGVKKISLLLLCASLALSTFGQTYSFKSIISYDNFEVQPAMDGVYCLFRVSEKKAPVSVFKKVFLSADLQPIDSVNYLIEGHAQLLSSCSDEKFVTHTFYSSTPTGDKIIFFVTDHLGKTQATFFKTAADFSRYLPKPVKKLKNIQLSFLPNNGSPGMLLLQPYQVQSSVLQKGKIFSLNAEDGKEVWVSSLPPLYNIQTTEKLLFGLNTANAGGANASPFYQICIVDKESGKLIKAFPFTSKGAGDRLISVFATNGSELMVAGSEFESGKTKDGRFYMTLFNLKGEKIFDQVDSSALLSTRRLHIMGNTFDQDGNLVLIGEGWRPDATRAIAGAAGSIALALLTRGAYTRVYATGIDHKIESVVFAFLSPEDGKLKSVKTYPVGPWLTYGRLMTEGAYALFHVKNQVIIYDVNNPNRPPSPFTTLRPSESLILTPSGPIINKKANGYYTLSRVR